MDIGTISIVAAFITMLALLALGVHIGITLGLSGMLGFIIFHGKVSIAPIQLAFQQFLSVNTTYAFIIIPLFMLLGFLGSETGVAEDLFDAADKWFGHLRGGLAVTTIVACSGMAAITGSSLGTAVAMTKIALPQMRKHKYDDRLSLGAITVGATLSIMIPPSITLVLYGIFGQQSIGKLLIAGILPGLMTAFFYIIQIIVRCRIQPELCLLALKYNWRTKISSLPKVIPFVSVMVGMMAGILLGIWTPVEASGAGCIFVFLIALVRRRLRTRTFFNCLTEGVVSSSAILILITGAMVFGRFLGVTGMGDILVNYILSLHLSQLQLFFLLVVIYVTLGMFVETGAIIVITVPIIIPLIKAVGWDPIWFGVIFVELIEIALVTPPIGLTLYAVRSVIPEVPMSRLAMSCVPYWLCNITSLFVLYLVPNIALVLPNMMRGQ